MSKAVNFKVIDTSAWSRREIYNHFSDNRNFPFYCVSFNVEIQNLYEFCKRTGTGVYHTMIWCGSRACNAVGAFRQRIVDGKVVEYDRVFPSYTFLPAGEDAFRICTLDAGMDSGRFDRIAREAERKQVSLFPETDIPPEPLVFISCLPWIETTCITNERNIDRNESHPAIAWGKFRKNADGTIVQNISVDVNHRLVDGYHIGLFGKHLQEIINEL